MMNTIKHNCEGRTNNILVIKKLSIKPRVTSYVTIVILAL